MDQASPTAPTQTELDLRCYHEPLYCAAEIARRQASLTSVGDFAGIVRDHFPDARRLYDAIDRIDAAIGKRKGELSRNIRAILADVRPSDGAA